jgi:endoglucanase
LFATDYDLGRINYAYYDVDSGNYWVSSNKRTEWNKGWQYRNEGVDIEKCNDSLTNGYSVGWTENGEWLHYTVDVAANGTYDLNLRYASKDSSGKVELVINNISAATMDLPVTGAYTSWRSSASFPVKLEKGVNTIKLYITRGGVNINYIQFIYEDNTANTNYR